MTMISCIKQVYDLDIVLKDDWLVSKDMTIDIDYANRVMNTFDEASLELMLRLCDYDETVSQVVTIGEKSSETMLRKALALGVTSAVRIETEKVYDYNPLLVAHLLKDYISGQMTKNIQIIFCGQEADIGNHGQTGQLLAELLGLPCISRVTDIKRFENAFRISHLVDGGIEHIMVDKPVLVTVTQSENKLLRMATLKASLEAKKKTIKIFTPNDYKDTSYSLKKLKINAPKNHCEFLENIDHQTKVDHLIKILKEKRKV